MKAEEYKRALATLGLTQASAAKLLGVKPRTSERWAAGVRDVTGPAARLLRYLIHVGADPARVADVLQPENDDADAK